MTKTSVSDWSVFQRQLDDLITKARDFTRGEPVIAPASTKLESQEVRQNEIRLYSEQSLKWLQEAAKGVEQVIQSFGTPVPMTGTAATRQSARAT